jgi:hypothetical protein
MQLICTGKFGIATSPSIPRPVYPGLLLGFSPVHRCVSKLHNQGYWRRYKNTRTDNLGLFTTNTNFWHSYIRDDHSQLIDTERNIAKGLSRWAAIKLLIFNDTNTVRHFGASRGRLLTADVFIAVI